MNEFLALLCGYLLSSRSTLPVRRQRVLVLAVVSPAARRKAVRLEGRDLTRYFTWLTPMHLGKVRVSTHYGVELNLARPRRAELLSLAETICWLCAVCGHQQITDSLHNRRLHVGLLALRLLQRLA